MYIICMHAQSLSHVQLFVTLWTVACQDPLSIGFFRQEYCSGLPFPPPGDIPNPATEPVSPVSPTLQVDSMVVVNLSFFSLFQLSLREKAKHLFHAPSGEEPSQWSLYGFPSFLSSLNLSKDSF